GYIEAGARAVQSAHNLRRRIRFYSVIRLNSRKEPLIFGVVAADNLVIDHKNGCPVLRGDCLKLSGCSHRPSSRGVEKSRSREAEELRSREAEEKFFSVRDSSTPQLLDCLTLRLPPIKHRIRAVDHFHFVVREVFSGQRLHHLTALVVKPAQFPPWVPRERIVREDRHGDGRIRVANHRIGQAVGIHFPPAYGFAGSSSAQSAG